MFLELDNLSKPLFWDQYCDKNSNKIPLTIVYPSGRAGVSSSGHLALISDALYIPEIVIRIQEICNSVGNKGLLIRSLLDIDFYDELYEIRNNVGKAELNDPLNIINSNIIMLATADINIVCKVLLDESKSIETYKIGYKRPYEDCIILGGSGSKYSVMAYPYIGVLGLYSIPWAKYNRIAIMSGGIFAPGTLASNLLLYHYLKGESYGNNRFNKEIPVKIVSSSFRDYHNLKIIPIADCLPQHELRNISEHIKIHE